MLSTGNTVALAASLRYQHRLFFREIGALAPEVVPLADLKQVLDVFCGPGTWCIELSAHFPDLQIVGVDSNAELVEMAQQDAQLLIKADPPIFEHCSTIDHLPYSNDRFDLIHAYYSSMMMLPQICPSTLHELWRVLRPGGYLHLVQLEAGPVSSDAARELFAYLDKASRIIAGNVSPKEDTIVSAVSYPQLLAQAGYSNISYAFYPVDLGNQREPAGRDYVRSLLADGEQVTNRLSDAELASRERIVELVQETMKDAQKIDYFCAGVLISIVASKPGGTVG